MSGFNNIGPGSGIKVGYIANEGKSDSLTDDESSHQKIGNAQGLHGSSVSPDDYSFSSLMQPPTQFGQQSFPGILDPGTIVYYLAQDGMNGGVILGHSSTIQGGGSGSGAGGGVNLTDAGHIGKVRKSKLDVNTPPEIQETTERGAKIKKPVEKGEQHSLDMLDGLPIHGALFDMAGFRLPEIKKVPTAKKQGQMMLDQNMLGQMMGQIMSMGGMLQGLKGKGGGGQNSNLGGLTQQGTYKNERVDGYVANVGQTAVFFSNTAGAGPGNAGWGNVGNNRFDVILQKLPPHMRTALTNYSRLVQGVDNLDVIGSKTPEISYLTGDVVHPGTVLKNAEEMLSQVTNISDFMYVMRQLQSNTAYHGLDKLSNVTVTVDTAWGKAKKTMDKDGNITIRYSDAAKKEMANFSMAMANSSIASGFGSLPANTKMVLTKVGREIKVEANANVSFAKFVTNTKNTVMVQVYSPTKNVLSTIVTRSTAFEQKYKSDGKKRIYDVEKQYDPRPEKVKIYVDNILVESKNYLAVDTKTFELYTVPETGANISFKGYTLVTQPPITVPPPAPTRGGGTSGGTGGGGGGGGGIGQNIMGQMFGKSSGQMQELMKRLHPTGEQESKKMTQQLNQDQTAQKLMEIAKKTINGGDPLMKNLF